jgi:hypothetical protein
MKLDPTGADPGGLGAAEGAPRSSPAMKLTSPDASGRSSRDDGTGDELRFESSTVRRSLKSYHDCPQLVGCHPSVQSLLRNAFRAASGSASCLSSSAERPALVAGPPPARVLQRCHPQPWQVPMSLLAQSAASPSSSESSSGSSSSSKPSSSAELSSLSSRRGPPEMASRSPYDVPTHCPSAS